MNDIGGNVCIRDGEETDYPWREAVRSLLPICDSVTICDGGSTDGTLEAIQEWQKTEPKIRLVHFPWSSPKGEFHFWVRWLNFCREHIDHYWHLQLDADEVLYEGGYDWILDFTRKKEKKSALMLRLNFWKDTKHLIPKGEKCGYEVVRLGPQKLWMPTDYPHPDGHELCSVQEWSPVQIAHYGMLRKPQAFFLKERRFQNWVFGSYDPRSLAAETAPNYSESIAESCGWRDRIEDYHNSHPAVAHQWLRDRGYEV